MNSGEGRSNERPASANGESSTRIASPAAFPPGFVWGVATSAHQVEGNNSNNQWAAWEDAGRIKSRDRVELACDWWRNAEQDFDIAQSLGVNALRLSLEWSRIEPAEGQWDNQALKRYRQMLQALIQRGIRPFITLHHFTNPLWLESKGGFGSPDSIVCFERFARRVVGALGDLCTDWITFNEPNVYTALGYFLGEFPPGKKGHVMEAARVTRNMSLAHAAAYRAIHELQQQASVGWAQHFVVFKPRRPASPLDRWICSFIHRQFNDNFFEGIREGKAPFPLNFAGTSLPEVKDTCDYIGINYYSRLRVGFEWRSPKTLFIQISVPPHKPQGDCGVELPYGEAYPQGLQQAAGHFSSLNKPIYILENGVPDRSDRIRPWLLQSVFDQMRSLLARDVDLRGYFHWTLTDNFEWNEGWHLRFGLVELDTATQERRIRPSARLYSELIQANQRS